MPLQKKPSAAKAVAKRGRPPKVKAEVKPKAKAKGVLKKPSAAKAVAKSGPKPKVKTQVKAKPAKSMPREARETTPMAKIDRTKIYAVVPARSGSKGVIGKNIKDFCGKPLMAWQIENGVKSKYISRVFVSTDSEEYKKIAMEHGAEVPFLRPAEIAHGTATDYQLLDHFIRWMAENEPQQQPSLLVQLRPTAPCLDTDTVDSCIEAFLNHEDENYDSLRTVTPVDHEAFNQYFCDPYEPHRLVPVIPTSHHKDDPSQIIPEPQSVARQILPQIYWHNAYVDIIRPETILEQKCVMGGRCLSFPMDAKHNVDIDTPEQWAAAEVKKRAQLAAMEEAKQQVEPPAPDGENAVAPDDETAATALDPETAPATEVEMAPAPDAEMAPAPELEMASAPEVEMTPASEAEMAPTLEAEMAPASEAEMAPTLEAEMAPVPDVNSEE